MANDEYMTPLKYMKSIKNVLGEIDLDIFSSKVANERIKARNFYTKEISAWDKIWHGNCYANPPYSRGNLPKYSRYLIGYKNSGHILQSISLLPNSTSEKWFHDLLKYPRSVACLTDHRIKFTTFENGRFVENSQPDFGNAFIYLGMYQEKFADVFTKYGTIVSQFHRK